MTEWISRLHTGRLSRRRFLHGSGIAAGSLTFGGMLTGKAAAQTAPIWYAIAYVESIEGLAKLYKEKTGGSVEYIRMAATKVTQSFEQEVRFNQVKCSIVGTTLVPAAQNWADQGWLEPYKHSERDAYPEDVLIGDYVTPITSYVNCIGFNGDLIARDEAPKDWEGFLDPKWKGKMVMGDAVTSTGTMQWYAALREILGVAYFEELAKQDILLHTGGGEVLDSLISGERPLSPVVQQYHVARGIGQGANLYVNYPEGGVPVIYDFIAIPAQAPAIEEAKKFVDFALGLEAQTLWQQEYGMSSLRNDMPPLPPALAERGLLASSDIKRLKSSVKESMAFSENYDALAEEFTRLFK